ncbi:MAG: PCMD domain-containing protein [Prevotella sp.]|nr:PCMD domain-containing protein [Prevotella sp.]
MFKTQNFILLAYMLLMSINGYGQERFVPFKYGDFNSWVTRHVKESGIIGGDTKTLYEVGPTQSISGNEPYTNKGGSPWGTSNVMAKVSGITKTNVSVFREKRDAGYCAKLVTHIEKVKVLGLININVLAAGSLYLGDMKEPITGTKEGPQALNWGIPFTGRPKALRYDYKVAIANSPDRIRLTGFSGKSTIKGKDLAVTVLLLQKRHEDAKGNITAKRVGTLVITYDKSTQEWKNGATYEIWYGDIRRRKDYNAELMGLRSTDYARNSHGKSVPVKETGFATAGEKPTHLVLQFSSSHGGAYIGSPGNTFWVDNVGLVY